MKLKRFIGEISWWLMLPICLAMLLPIAVFEWLDSEKTYPETVREAWRFLYKDRYKNG